MGMLGSWCHAMMQISAMISALTHCAQGTNFCLILAMMKHKLWTCFMVSRQTTSADDSYFRFFLVSSRCLSAITQNRKHWRARYPPHGRRTVVLEDGIQWERVRAPPVKTLAHDLHASDCLHELRPGDNIEIQWRRNKEFPYGMFLGAQQWNVCFGQC